MEPRENPDQGEQAAPPTQGGGAGNATDVDRAMDAWRQGDVLATEAVPFVALALKTLPLSEAARLAADDSGDQDDILEVFTRERGLVVVGQTCDVVRSCADRPYVEVSPLVELEADDYREVERGRSLRFAVIPSLAHERLVADLDRIMTVEKALLAHHHDKRVAGCTSDGERRVLASTLARRRGRFAFPDDFAEGVAKMVEHVVAKHDKASPLGQFLAGLADIRATCADWDADRPDVEIVFVFPTLTAVPADSATHVAALLKRFVRCGKFDQPRGRAANLETMSAAHHLRSDTLELEYVSRRRKAAK